VTRSEAEQLAAEYVLGTLSAAERAEIERARAGDAQLDAAVREWERRLAPLNETTPEAAPAPGTWRKIEARIDAAEDADASDSNVIQLRRKVVLWRGLTAAATALAAAIAALAYLGPLSAPPAGERYIAVASSDKGGSALLVTIDTGARTVEVFPVSLEAPAGRSLQLWYALGKEKPRSLGLIQASAPVTSLDLRNLLVHSDGHVAVSVEPMGGSPTGAPTGPVLFVGNLVPGPAPSRR
jgi:anti-sigma-K factor RskA